MRFVPISLRFQRKPKLPMVLQEEMADCAHACIAMLCGYWGQKLSLADLRHLKQTSSMGMNLHQMNEVFDQLKFKTRVLRVPLEDLAKVKKPAILHWNTNHFVVLKTVTARHIVIHDPAVGIRHIRRTDLSQYFKGIVLEAELAGEMPRFCQNSGFLSLWALFKSVRGISQIISILLCLSVLIECLQVINPMFMQYVTDYAIGAHAVSQIYHIGIGCILFVGLEGLAEFIRQHLIVYSTIRLTESFSSSLFKHILALPLRFFSQRHVADIHAKFESIESLKTQLGTDVIRAWLDGSMIVVILVVMMLYSGILTLIVMIIMAVYGGLLYGNLRVYQTKTSAALALHLQSSVTFLEVLRGIVPIKVFLKEHQWFQIWRNDYIDALNHNVQMMQLQIRHRVCNQVLSHLEYVLIICVGAGLVVSQRLSTGTLLAFLAYRMLLMSKSTAFVQYLFTRQDITTHLGRLQDLLTYTPEPVSTVHMPSHVEGVIDIHALTFAYPGQKRSLFQDLNLTISPGEKIAIIGPSGCGKTSLLRVMMGLEQPIAGSIAIDGIPLQQFGIQNFRKLSASVLQDDVLFTGSILDNIVFFAEDIDKIRVYEVAKLACIHDMILDLPMGYNSLIGQHQTTLSGGQRQRILLARALYKNPMFLFLDEATSHLDLQLELMINKALKNCSMTQIIVAHRPETIALADRVINL